ncbi:Smr/MutS family protein [Asticcacaulis sp. AC402]|uniref:Smr/MutS family protein n=1 Tax=Asticcacaulis sp. AC402 TaxID=1282361 RepID=UPI0003C3BAF0|nr:Smr/MutS family protein [Asticcacaulis sp. AC402]ESQ74165.1 DNA mismatch repair protein MutS [Asticcacaulis sp. AC402]
MSRFFTLKPEDMRLWSLVTATVRPHRASRITPGEPEPKTETETVQVPGMAQPMVAQKPKPVPATPFQLGQIARAEPAFRFIVSDSFSPDPIEPRRKRRLSRERDPIEARLDLHGMNSLAAEARLKAFVQQAYANDYRAVLVITGKGMAENGILKRNAPEWLADPALGHIVAGISLAHARHGGSGALYVALKRRS